MRNDRHLAIKLRKKGFSYSEISRKLDIPKSTMHYWFRDLKWSNIIKRKLSKRAKALSTKRMRAIARANKKRWSVWRKQHRKNAFENFHVLKNKPLFITGLMLYWGEGDSNLSNGRVKLANTDPKMIKIFSFFLQKICQVPKEQIRIALILYPDLDEEQNKLYWHKFIKIPLKQFIKVQFIYGRHPTKRLSHGICMIYISSRAVKEKIFVWLNLLQKDLLRE